ncbi:prepilin peptidase, partial [Campylobacter coli]|nr:prepilin peptidase [Campylobacter coli]EAL5145269.1 prepilin peptidase [Campylobacter coli]EFT0394044.1 prepilin peptidase [Campylobacter coli]EFV1928759.1 prepilin peptidase [Campylobacter coli]EHB5993436.1 prepilin peptidase [Campylobacter coli]
VQAFIFAGFLFLLKNFIAFLKNFRTKDIQENLGDADIIILASMAGVFGFKSAFIILFLASLLSLPFFIHNKNTKLAFLPFINAAFVIYLIYLIVQELI